MSPLLPTWFGPALGAGLFILGALGVTGHELRRRREERAR
jgi:hypothetical protein